MSYFETPTWKIFCRATQLLTTVMVLQFGLSWGITARAQPLPSVWTTTWASSQMTPGETNALSADDARNATLRQVVRVSLGGPAIRVRLSNLQSDQPLVLSNIHAALSLKGGNIDPDHNLVVTFGGRSEISLPAGADLISDEIALPVPDLGEIAISFYQADTTKQQTSHPGSRATSFLVHGDHSADLAFNAPTTFTHWFNISGVDVLSTANSRALVILGDSLTDGYGVQADTNGRWTDTLAARLAPLHIAIVNAGIGGNRLLNDGLGPSALARFDHDVLSQSGARMVIVLEGINDLGMATKDGPLTAQGHADLVNRITSAYLQLIYKAHSHGLRIMGATLSPFSGSDYYHPDIYAEADRQLINRWIRAPGHFDEVIDFDSVLRDPNHSERLMPSLDSGDHLHPSILGYTAMGEAVNLQLFANPAISNWSTASANPRADVPQSRYRHGPISRR